MPEGWLPVNVVEAALEQKDKRIAELEEQCLILEHKVTAIKIICETTHENLLKELKDYNKSN